MATQTFALDTVVSSSALNGATVANLNAQDASWSTATGTNTDTFVQAGFPSPAGNPNAGANLQTITFQARKTAASGAGTPTVRAEIWISGGAAPVLTGPANNVTSAVGQVFTFQFDYSAVPGATANGSNIEARIYATKSGGSPSQRAAADIGYVGWTADYSVPAPFVTPSSLAIATQLVGASVAARSPVPVPDIAVAAALASPAVAARSPVALPNLNVQSAMTAAAVSFAAPGATATPLDLAIASNLSSPIVAGRSPVLPAAMTVTPHLTTPAITPSGGGAWSRAAKGSLTFGVGIGV